ncbi:hypothetical protein DIPPA_18267 [Diplonema papillatum]|nr:hypothetical protein DIPPA_18267 [Diplonema papillatum]
MVEPSNPSPTTVVDEPKQRRPSKPDAPPRIPKSDSLVIPKTIEFLNSADARDKLLKLSAYSIRLAFHRELFVKLGWPVTVQDRLKRLDTAIIDCRQVLNCLKWISTIKAFFTNLSDTDMPRGERLALLIQTAFWTVEVVCSDLSYVAKQLKPEWDANRIGKGYKMGKSISLTILIAVESWRVNAMLDKAKQEHRRLTVVQRSSVKESLFAIARCVCDCIIYYTWVNAYKPNKTLCYLCGLLSAIIGLRGQILSL